MTARLLPQHGRAAELFAAFATGEGAEAVLVRACSPTAVPDWRRHDLD